MKKNAPVKVRLCPDCSWKLNYRKKQKEVTKISVMQCSKYQLARHALFSLYLLRSQMQYSLKSFCQYLFANCSPLLSDVDHSFINAKMCFGIKGVAVNGHFLISGINSSMSLVHILTRFDCGGSSQDSNVHWCACGICTRQQDNC